MHGANYGLDETEAFESEIAGMVEAITKGLYPPKLKRISIAEIYEPRAKRLRVILRELFPEGVIRAENEREISKRSHKDRSIESSRN